MLYIPQYIYLKSCVIRTETEISILFISYFGNTFAFKFKLQMFQQSIFNIRYPLLCLCFTKLNGLLVVKIFLLVHDRCFVIIGFFLYINLLFCNSSLRLSTKPLAEIGCETKIDPSHPKHFDLQITFFTKSVAASRGQSGIIDKHVSRNYGQMDRIELHYVYNSTTLDFVKSVSTGRDQRTIIKKYVPR